MATPRDKIHGTPKEWSRCTNCKETGLRRYYSTPIANAPVAWQPSCNSYNHNDSKCSWLMSNDEKCKIVREKDAWDRAKNPEKWLKMAYDPNTYDVFKESMLWSDEVNPWFTKHQIEQWWIHNEMFIKLQNHEVFKNYYAYTNHSKQKQHQLHKTTTPPPVKTEKKQK